MHCKRFGRIFRSHCWKGSIAAVSRLLLRPRVGIQSTRINVGIGVLLEGFF